MSEPLEAVARRCFAREEARRREKKKGWQLTLARFWSTTPSASRDLSETIGCAWPLLKLAGLGLAFGLLLDSVVLGFGAGAGALALLRLVPPRLRVSRRQRAFRDGDPAAMEAVYRFAVEEFRAQVERHRARTLGNESEWAVARASLVEAVDGAQRSAAYWRARLAQDPDNQMCAGQLKTATGLHAKLRSALDKLDERGDILLRFYNDCEARIAVMDRYNRDIEETRRLDRLSGAADMVIAGAETALMEIGASFLREAGKVGEVLGNFERLQLKSLAGEAPLDDVEYLADRINEASEREFDTVEQLSRAIEESAGPIGP